MHLTMGACLPHILSQEWHLTEPAELPRTLLGKIKKPKNYGGLRKEGEKTVVLHVLLLCVLINSAGETHCGFDL